eukprot:c28618_g1_i1 orf=227-2896(+)
MARIDLRRACLDSFSRVAEDFADALVYVDVGVGEALHFIGGLATLLPFNPRAVCSLERSSPVDSNLRWSALHKGPVQKILVMTARLLSDAHRYILRCLRMHSSIKQCIILTSVSQEAHSAHPDTPLGSDAFHEYESLLLQDFQTLVKTAESEQIPERCGQFSLGKGPKDKDQQYLSNCADDERIEPGIEVSREKSNVFDTRESKEFFGPGLSVIVKHFPMVFCPITSRTFVLPSGAAVAEAYLSAKVENSLGPGLPCIEIGKTSDGEDHIPPGGILLAHFLQHFSGQLDLKLDIFTIGPLAHCVGKRLSGLSRVSDISGRTKRTAGLLLIDRTLDLITPACHGDSLVDRFFSLLPRRNIANGHPRLLTGAASVTVKRFPLDLRVSLRTDTSTDNIGNASFEIGRLLGPSFFHSSGSDELEFQDYTRKEEASERMYDRLRYHARTNDSIDFMGGSLFDSVDSLQLEHLETLFGKRTKESALMIRKWLHDALRQEKISLPGRGRVGVVTSDELHSLWKKLASRLDCALRHSELIQLARAAEEVLGSSHSSRWEALASAEKILMLNAGDSSQNVVWQIRDLVHQSTCIVDSKASLSQRHRHSGLISLKDALTLAIVGYGLAGDCFRSSISGELFSWDEEQELKEAIVNAILEGSPGTSLGFLKGLENSLEMHWERQQCSANEKEVSLENTKTSQAVEDDDHAILVEEWENWGDPFGQDCEEQDKDIGGGALYDDMQLKLELRDRLEEVFKILHKVADLQRRLPIKDKSWSTEEKNGFGGSSALQKSFIYKVLSLAFSKADIPGLEHQSSSVGRFLKSGLGRFGLGQVNTKLSDYKVLMVFVIGGINAVEDREIKEAQSTFPEAEGVELLFGGTTFLTPEDIYDLLIGSSSSL